MIRSSRLAVVLVLGLSLALPALAKEDGKVDLNVKSTVDWGTSYAGAVKSAKADDKPLLFKFYTGWCPHCVRMDNSTWKDVKVGEISKAFTAAKVNADVEKVPVKRYSLVGYPTTIVAAPGGEEVFRLEGYKDAKTVGLYLKTYLKHADDVGAAFAKLRDDRNDADAHLALARFYRTVGKTKRAIARYEKAMKNATGDAWLEACVGSGACLAKKKEYKAASKQLKKALGQAGDSPSAELMLAMGQTEQGLGRNDAARGWYQKVVSGHAGTEEAKKAEKALGSLG
ncbi:MAG: thioredoxin domain-containing protein [Acidobacteriota bacterium]